VDCSPQLKRVPRRPYDTLLLFMCWRISEAILSIERKFSNWKSSTKICTATFCSITTSSSTSRRVDDAGKISLPLVRPRYLVPLQKAQQVRQGRVHTQKYPCLPEASRRKPNTAWHKRQSASAATRTEMLVIICLYLSSLISSQSCYRGVPSAVLPANQMTTAAMAMPPSISTK
jgi:hypothetical protein